MWVCFFFVCSSMNGNVASGILNVENSWWFKWDSIKNELSIVRSIVTWSQNSTLSHIFQSCKTRRASTQFLFLFLFILPLFIFLLIWFSIFYFFLLPLFTELKSKSNWISQFLNDLETFRNKWLPLRTRSVNKIPNSSLSVFSSFSSLVFSLFFMFLFRTIFFSFSFFFVSLWWCVYHCF